MASKIKEIIAVFLAAVALCNIDVSGRVLERVQEIRNEQQQLAREQVQEADVEILAKLVWGEARGCSKTEQAAVIWCVLNRIDAGYGPDVRSVVTAKGQFTGYRSGNPATQEHKDLAEDVLIRWYMEAQGIEDVGRVLPSEYLFFAGSGGHNHFRPEYRSSIRWDWSLPSPYDD